ncbi:MAG: flagellar hook capping FlgD N-terminal domain-containing protein [Planctomycetota bacterium]|nr:flagellar hook capping FlgD N-terminal domain-containing protein [Planctomycetota bacterium]
MAVDPITGSAASTTSQASAFSSLTSEEFAKIIFAELGKQDPLAPQDTGALIDQIAGIRSIQSNMDLTSNLEKLVGQNEFASASSLIGRYVRGLSTDLEQVAGTVERVGRTRDGTLLTLNDGSRLLISSVESVSDVPPEDEAAGGAS